MQYIRNNDRDYCDFGEESPSDGESSSSDDDIGVILHGTPEQKRKLREKITRSSESDDFELEMDHELDNRIQSLNEYKGSISSTQPTNQQTVTEPMQEAGSSDDEAELGLGPKLTNDELFYDPDMDEDDQRWVDAQRRRQHTSGTRKRATNSDAVLDCPACLTTLCIDCQRHSIYNNQYRAMFVMNCTVDRSALLSYPEQTRKRWKKANRNTLNIKQPRTIDCSQTQTSVPQDKVRADHGTCKANNTQTTSTSCSNQPITEQQDLSPCAVDKGTLSMAGCGPRSSVNSSQTTVDDFYGVNCSECNTRVAVIDQDEVYHFYNVLAAYT